MQRVYPDFFLVGAPKSGTTSMDRWLGAHPEVLMASAKESHHFAPDLLAPGEPLAERARYLELFERHERFRRVGESSVYYLMSGAAPRLLREFCPECRILVHLRHPVDLLYSHHSQLVYEGIEEHRDFETALRATEERRWERPDVRRRVRVAAALDYFRVVDFVSQLRRYEEWIPREQIHVVLFDDLQRDPAGVFERVLRFLDVDAGFRVSFDAHNKNKVVRSPRLREMLRNPPGWLSVPSRLLLPGALRNEIKRRVKRMNTRFVVRPPMSAPTRERLLERLRPGIVELGAHLGRDLSGWLEPAPAGAPGA